MELLENFLAGTTVVDELVTNLIHNILDYLDIDLAGGGSGHHLGGECPNILLVEQRFKRFPEEKRRDSSVR